jgi:hypothetical protein
MENCIVQIVAGSIGMNLFTIIGIVILIGILILLTVPWRIRLNGWVDDQKGVAYSASLDWGLKVLQIAKTMGRALELSILGLPVARFSGFPKSKKKQKKEKKTSRAIAGVINRHRQAIIQILVRMARAVFLKGHLVGRIGLPDPADTALIALFSHLVRQPSERFKMALTCVYDEEVVHIHANLHATLLIGYLLLTAGMLLLERPTRMMLRGFRHA